MAAKMPLRILCLDGGGIRGLSSLHILKELMSQIRRFKESGSRQKPRSALRPCDYFDLICGTGTGGILAIMLGRLQYDIETAIKAYTSLATAVFETRSSEDRALFDAATLETEILKIIKNSPDGSKEDAIFEDPQVTADTRNCRTFVLASRPEGLGNAAVRMRSYATEDDDPFQAQIWQVAKATSAAPTYFLPIDINGISYGDGRIGWNNPTMEAINEASYVWPGRPIACVVSIGTGLEDAIQLATESRISLISGVLGQLFRGLTPNQAFELAIAQYCVSCVTSCERIHEQVASSRAKYGIDGPWQYVRLNVPQGMAKIGLQEWKKLRMIAAMTQDYMQEVDVRELKRKVAERLISPEYYSVPASASASVPSRLSIRRIEYSMAQRQIGARGDPTTYAPATSNIQESGRSNTLAQQQIFTSRQQQGPLKEGYSESSSDESGTEGRGQMKRNKVETESTTSLAFSAANSGRLRDPHTVNSSRPPVDIHQSQQNVVVEPSKTASYGDDEYEDQIFHENFGCNELSATVLCCEYLECRSMGALQKDYLKDHYITYHNESLIKPSMVIPSATSMMQSRSFRCSMCLRKLMDDNQGRTCDNCQRFEPIQYAAMNTGLRHTNDTSSAALISNMSVHIPRRADLRDAPIRPPGPYLEDLDASNDSTPNRKALGSPLEEDAERNSLPKPSFWTPPEVPEHWTSYTPSTPRRINANTGNTRSRPLSSYKSPHTMPASVKKAREEYRRQRLYHESA